MSENRLLSARTKELEAQLEEKDRLIADLVGRLLGSREHDLEERVQNLEKALAKWMAAALKGKIEIVPAPHRTTRSTRTQNRKQRAG